MSILTNFVRGILIASQVGTSFVRFLCFIFTIIVISAQSSKAIADVIISEFMASNDSTLADEDGQFSDWIELFNNGNSPVDVSNWYLTDDEADLTLWQLPATSIAAGDYLVIFASGKNRSSNGSELHTNFKLSSGGEYLGLVLADGQTVTDSYSPEYPQQFTDISFGGTQYFNNPTPGSQNNAGVDGVIEDVAFSLEHGFYNSTQTLNLSSTTANAQIRYSLDGSTPSTRSGCTPPADGSAWEYEYFEGTWSVLPDFDFLTPIATGTTNTISTALKQREDFFAFRFSGCIEVSKSGLYTFSTSSDDGSQLLINDQLVVNNDGLHALQTVTQSLVLDEGLHSVTVTMFEHGGGDSISTQWSSPERSNAYITSIDNGVVISDPLTAVNSQNVIEFEFDLTTSGQFSFDTKIQGLTDDSNSFWVQLNNGPLWLFDVTIATNIINQMLSDRNSGVISQSLSAGEHRLRFYMREDGTRLDSVNVLGTNCDGPCEPQLLEAESASVSGNFIAAGSTSELLRTSKWLTYTNPITIDSTSTVTAVAFRENFLSPKPVTQSYLFVNDIINQSSNEQPATGWPAGPINGQDLDYGMDPQIVNSNPQAVRESLSSLPAVSIVTDLDNLFHPDLGIYVNAQNKGRYWERPASVELIDPEGLEPGFSIDAGIRVRGGFSRIASNPKHAFRLFFRGSYGGDLDYPLFGDEGTDSFEKVDLRTPQNYSWSFRGDNRNTFLREVWSRDTQKAMNHIYTKSRYYHLFINGIYWGVYMSQERVSKEFASTYFGAAEGNYDVVKHNRSDDYRYEATDGTNNAWNTLWNYISDQTINSAEYAAILQTVDINNLIDYILINAYEGDTDGSPSAFLNSFKRSNNWYAIFDRTTPNSKWTFYQHDGEHALGVRRRPDLEENLLGPFPPFNGQNNEFYSKDYFGPYWLHGALAKNSDYRQLFIDRSAMHFSPGGALSTAQALNRWNQRKQQVAPAILAESARWGDSKTTIPFTVNDWLNEVNYTENSFFQSRSNIVFNQLIAQGLASNMPAPEFSVPSGSIIEPGTDVSITNNSNIMLYYTLDGSDPRLPGGGISPNALLLMPGQSLTINSDVNITIRYYNGSAWGPVSYWTFSVNAIPVIDPIQNQISTMGETVNLTPVATDDDDLIWAATNLPNGLNINATTGEIGGTINDLGLFNITVSVNDGSVTTETAFSWWVVPKAKLVLNEYNAVSGSKYLGGGDNSVNEPADSRLGRIMGNGGDWFELVVIEDHLDIRNWQLSIVDDGAPAQVLVFSNNPVWADLRAGTIITVSENSITAANGQVFGQDISYSPANNDWWINVVAGNAGDGQYITAENISISNDNWQVEILNDNGQTMFGPVGEGIGRLSGVNSEEVGKLEADPQPYINPGSAYEDGTSSTFGSENTYAAGTQVQNFDALRSIVNTDINLSVADAVVNEGAQQANVVVSLSQASNQDISFQISTANISAMDGFDYTGINSQQTISAGDISTTVMIPIINDTLIEADETFSVIAANATNAVITDSTATITIIDNDSGNALPVLSIENASAIEGKNVRFDIRLSEPSNQQIRFDFNTQDGSANSATDYISKTGSRRIEAGATEKSIWVVTVDDTEIEADETFTLEISNPRNATIGAGTATATLINNDQSATLPSLSITNISVAEDIAIAQATVRLSQASSLDVNFQASTIDMTATAGTDYTAQSSVQTITAGDIEKTIWIPIADDNEIEPNEMFTLEISNATNAVIANSFAVITIIDNDNGGALPVLDVSDASAIEGKNVRFDILLSEPSTEQIRFNFTTVDGSATAATDYTIKSGSRRIEAGQTAISIWVVTTDDTQSEPDETFTLQLSDAINAVIGDGSATGTLLNDDNSNVIETIGKPVINRSIDNGIFIWQSGGNNWNAEVTSADLPRTINIEVASTQAIANVVPVNIESSDTFTQSTNGLDLSLNVSAPWMDGFRFSVQPQSSTCLSTSNQDVPIFVGPNRENVGSGFNLNTLTSCQ